MIYMERSDCRPVSLRDASELLRAFAHPIRLQLLDALRGGERGVTELVERSQLPQPMVSRHLAILRSAGVVRCEAVGREKVYGMADRRAQPLLDVLFGGAKTGKEQPA